MCDPRIPRRCLMSIESSSTASRLEEFESHLRTARYVAAIQRRYLWIAQRFVDYLGRKCIAVEAARAPECEDFLRSDLRSWRRRHGRDPRNIFEWRRRHKTAVNVFLRLVHGHWPVAATPVMLAITRKRSFLNMRPAVTPGPACEVLGAGSRG